MFLRPFAGGDLTSLELVELRENQAKGPLGLRVGGGGGGIAAGLLFAGGALHGREGRLPIKPELGGGDTTSSFGGTGGDSESRCSVVD